MHTTVFTVPYATVQYLFHGHPRRTYCITFDTTERINALHVIRFASKTSDGQPDYHWYPGQSEFLSSRSMLDFNTNRHTSNSAHPTSWETNEWRLQKRLGPFYRPWHGDEKCPKQSYPIRVLIGSGQDTILVLPSVRCQPRRRQHY